MTSPTPWRSKVAASWNGSNDDFALARYNGDGSLDTTFGVGGTLTTAFGAGHDQAISLAIQSDGKLVVAGDTFNGSNYDFAPARYNGGGPPPPPPRSGSTHPTPP